MNILADTHTHSIVSGHAYSTILENVRMASEKGLKLIALTEHAPSMKHTTNEIYFSNLHAIPSSLFGVQVLKGVELNIIDFNGTIDLEERRLKKLDISIASLHSVCLKPGTKEENTRACIGAMENPWVDIIGHLGEPAYPIDLGSVFQKAKETGTLIEMNNASLVPGGLRHGSKENMKILLEMAKEENVPIVLGSDAHFVTGIGEFSFIIKMLEEMKFPEKLILNLDPQRLVNSLKRNRARIEKPLL